jgi:hypothetical protein
VTFVSAAAAAAAHLAGSGHDVPTGSCGLVYAVVLVNRERTINRAAYYFWFPVRFPDGTFW